MTYGNSLGFEIFSQTETEIVYSTSIKTLGKMPITLKFVVNLESTELKPEDVERLSERTTYYLERYFDEMSEEISLTQKLINVTYLWNPGQIGSDLPKLIIGTPEPSRDFVLTRGNFSLQWANVKPVPNLVHIRRLPA